MQLNIPGLSIAYKTWGNSQNPPILALHGWLDNANSFAPLAEYLQHDFHLIAVDLPGHGLSSHLPEGMNYHFIDGLYTIVQIIEALKLKNIHLLGHSLGACIASLVVAIAPHHFSSLSLIEGLGPLTGTTESCHTQLKQFLDHINIHQPTPPKKYKDLDSAARIRAARGYVSLEIAKELCERGLEERDGFYYWRHDKRLLYPSPLRMTEQQVLSCLQAIQTKTLLIWANDGFDFNNEAMEQRMSVVSQLELEHLSGGHHIHMEQPKAVAALLAAFYRRN